MARTGAQWAYLPNDFPPAETVRQQAHRWFEAGCFLNAAHDLRFLARVEKSRNGEPTAIIIDSRTLQSTPESGHRAGFDGARKRKGTKVHLEVQAATGANVEMAFADQGYTGKQTALDAAETGVELVVVKRPEAVKGFILVPKRWGVERSFAWMSRFRRLGRDLERLSSTLIGFHVLAACVLLCDNLKPLFA